jgi:hypothetical protein
MGRDYDRDIGRTQERRGVSGGELQTKGISSGAIHFGVQNDQNRSIWVEPRTQKSACPDGVEGQPNGPMHFFCPNERVILALVKCFT